MRRNEKTKYIPILIFFSLILSVFLLSCKSDNMVTPTGSSAAVSVFGDNSVSDNNILVITSAKFLIEFVKLERVEEAEEEDIKIGPFVVNITLDSKAHQVALANVPAGTYKEVHIKIHKHTPGEVVIDPDFGTDVGYSGIIAGTFNGTPFVYRTAITSVQEMDIAPVIVISSSGLTTVNVTFVVKAGMWFAGDNGTILDPNDPANAQVIDQNIKASFRTAFEDEDHDGIPDHH